MRYFGIFLKISGLVSFYLVVVTASVFLTWPASGSAVTGNEKNYSYKVDAEISQNIPQKAVSVLIVPHHLVADKQIQGGFAYVAAARKNINTKRIILMGPNHFFKGQSSVITTDRPWQTNYGEIAADSDFINLMANRNLISQGKEIVEGDHSITSLLPFVEIFFPQADFVPLLMKEPISQQNAKILAKFLAENLDDETLIVASIDFSHYLPKEIADAHDKESIKALQTLDSNFLANKIDADSPHILTVLEKYLKLRGHIKFTLLHHTNSAELTGNLREPSTTSHIIGFFEK